jgi:HlyD family secretion protein
VFVNAAGRRMSLADAEEAYAGALNAVRIAEVNFEQSQARQADAVADAQEALTTAEANLAWAQRGPDAADLDARQDAVAVAVADLAEAQATLAELENGPDAATQRRAELRVEAAQATLDAQALRAPIAGEVLQVSYRPGDSVSQSQVAVVLANRTRLHVDAAVSEADIAQVVLGDAATLTFDAVPGLTLTGTVDTINPVGAVEQGLVKYTVRVNLPAGDPRVLLGMTASLDIVTDVQAGVLAVPVEAVQLDDAGEYVLRQIAAGQTERVSIVSGEVLEAAVAGTPIDVVTVSGDLAPGEVVVLVPATTDAASGGFFGPGGRP